jgi:ADP-heptose:LPS heptosyltransferase
MNFTHVYDAHSSLRSRLLVFFLRTRALFKTGFCSFHFLRKSQKRWKRFLLFKWRWNTYRKPFSGQRDLLEPLRPWGIDDQLPPPPQLFLGENVSSDFALLPRHFVALAPSAAHALKRWPLNHWKKLLELCPEINFVVLGGSEDQFLSELEAFPNVLNLAGKTNFIQTALAVKKSEVLICNDTGVMHFGEQLGHPTIALMGPAPFGFPSRPSTKIIEKNLSCRPCSKHGQGPCTNKVYQACLVSIDPRDVERELKTILFRKRDSAGRETQP